MSGAGIWPRPSRGRRRGRALSLKVRSQDFRALDRGGAPHARAGHPAGSCGSWSLIICHRCGRTRRPPAAAIHLARRFQRKASQRVRRARAEEKKNQFVSAAAAAGPALGGLRRASWIRSPLIRPPAPGLARLARLGSPLFQKRALAILDRPGRGRPAALPPGDRLWNLRRRKWSLVAAGPAPVPALHHLPFHLGQSASKCPTPHPKARGGPVEIAKGLNKLHFR